MILSVDNSAESIEVISLVYLVAAVFSNADRLPVDRKLDIFCHLKVHVFCTLSAGDPIIDIL